MNVLLYAVLSVSGPTGRPVPDLTLITLQGDTLQLGALRGNILLIDFWATWCPPCRAEMPFFNDLYQKYRDQGVLVIGINIDERESTVRRFIEKLGITYPVVMGTSRREGRAFGGIVGLPTTFVVDAEGRIRARAVGFHPREYFEGWIRKLLEERDASPVEAQGSP